MSSILPRVFICNRGGYDYAKAKEFGEITFLTEGELQTDDLNYMYRKAEKIAKEFKEEDFIVITGLTSFVTILSIFFAQKFKKVNLLVYKRGRYYPETLVFPTISG